MENANGTNGFQVDLTNCDKEPIHIPGFVQPHGFLLVMNPADLNIRQMSENTSAHLKLPTESILEHNLKELLSDEAFRTLQINLNSYNLLTNPTYLGVTTFDKSEAAPSFDVIGHIYEDSLILEFEPAALSNTAGVADFYSLIRGNLGKIQQNQPLNVFCQSVAEQVHELTGFDRVMVYRFDEEGHGQVVAEALNEGNESFLGLHYPATDIPKQARTLYIQNWLRLIANVHYTPSQVVPVANPITNRSLDMTYCALRSVSPLHIEYLKNMGVGASMSISIIKDNELWGLIACHHNTPYYLPYSLRMACEFLGQVISMQLAVRYDYENTLHKNRLKQIHLRLVDFMINEERFQDGLILHEPTVLGFLEADGCAIVMGDEVDLLGESPDNLEVLQLAQWLSQRPDRNLFHTNKLSALYEPALNFKDKASGVLAICISQIQKSYIFWFRPEIIQTVTWGGDPNKPVEGYDEDGHARLRPRQSFAAWKETVALTSVPWRDWEVDAAKEFRAAVISIILRKLDELTQLNVELQRSNSELDSFAYIASHDLKEPLRGIHNYSSILLEAYEGKLDDDGQAKLRSLNRLAQRMEDLIDSLLHYSRLGRVDLSYNSTDLNQLVEQVIDVLEARISQTNITIRRPKVLPTIMCDQVRIREALNNLITNAVKYSDSEKEDKWIEIGCTEDSNAPQGYIFYVRDNGIGIRPKHFETVFQIFKRLHTREQFGGGTGSGLTITKKIIERHNGRIWVDSTYGEGSTFYFTIGTMGERVSYE